ncbi:MAG: DGQHR domain-containing protein [Caldisphaera sp.]
MVNEIKISVVKGTQKGREMWLGLIKAKDVVAAMQDGIINIDVWGAISNPEGYQRELQPARADLFKKFIEEEDMFSPTTILLNVRDKRGIRFDDNWIVLSPSSKLWVVDGQHRLAGIKKLLDENLSEKYKQMDIPVIITALPNKFEEAILFAIFNKTQVGVKFDLVESVISEQIKKGNAEVAKLAQMYDRAGIKLFREVETKIDAITVSNRLNSKNDNPWYNKITLPNESKTTTRGKIIRLRSFTISLQILIKSMKKTLPNVDSDLVVSHLKTFWIALKELMPEAFENPKDYVLQKGPGVMIMHDMYLKILSSATGSLKVPELKELVEGLNKIKNFIGADVTRNFLSSDYWEAKNGRVGMAGSSLKSFSQIENEIDNELNAFALSQKGER